MYPGNLHASSGPLCLCLVLPGRSRWARSVTGSVAFCLPLLHRSLWRRSEALFPRQGSHVKNTWYGYGKNIKEKGLASPGLSGFKLLKQTKLSPSLLRQERPPGLCHGRGAGCTWRGESLQAQAFLLKTSQTSDRQHYI